NSTGVERRQLVASANGTFRLQSSELLAGNPAHKWDTFGCWSHDGRWLAFRQAGEKTIIVQNVDDSSKRYTLGPHSQVRYVALSADGRWLATGPWRGQSLRVWEVATGEIAWELPCDAGWAAFSPDGRWLATGTEKEYRLWHTGTWQPAPWRLAGGQYEA